MYTTQQNFQRDLSLQILSNFCDFAVSTKGMENGPSNTADMVLSVVFFTPRRLAMIRQVMLESTQINAGI